MSREKCLPTAQKALDKGSPSQRRGALGADTGILKTLDSAGFCFWRPFFSILLEHPRPASRLRGRRIRRTECLRLPRLHSAPVWGSVEL